MERKELERKGENKMKVKKVKSEAGKFLDKVIKAKEKKFGLKYNKCEELPEYRSYRLYAGCDTYGEYRHKASFYGVPVMKREDIFKWYQMFFEVKTDCVLAQENAPSREGYAKNIPTSSPIWTPKQLKTMRDYVLNWTNEYAKAKPRAKKAAVK